MWENTTQVLTHSLQVIHICVYVYMCVYACVCIWMRMCVYDICWHVEALLLGFSICVYVYICMRMCMCVHVCVYSAWKNSVCQWFSSTRFWQTVCFKISVRCSVRIRPPQGYYLRSVDTRKPRDRNNSPISGSWNKATHTRTRQKRGAGPRHKISSSYLGHTLDEHCLEGTRVTWCLCYPKEWAPFSFSSN